MPGLTLGDTVPNLQVETTHGNFKLHDYFGNNWTILFSHPADFTPVCTTELGKIAAYGPELESKGVKLLGLSCDPVQSHSEWFKDVEAYTPGCRVTYPVIADPKREILAQLNMVEPDLKDPSGSLVPSRALHIVGPDKKIKLSFLYPVSVGRNMDEVVRAVDALQIASKHKVATPVNWKRGDPVLIPPSVSNEEAQQRYPQGYRTVDLPSKQPYMRFTNLPAA
ncbi:1-Cys peroxiredoxin [Carica papaya]|uniref:1-Cys peroxiredoxin n=1 Tax=Carica papaya TaxID=3649 RepID=UPI000B8CBE49|nr:1-Cys peroxiredoxin [Carica papaya]